MLTASGPEVGANHREVDIFKSLDRFELHDDQRSHQQVQPMKPTMKPNLTAAIQDRHGQLPLEANTPCRKLEGEGVLVDRLQESRPKSLVDLNRSADDPAA
jgi:hypothetical protein